MTRLGLCLVLLTLAVVVQCGPTMHQVRSALERAREINLLRRELEQLDNNNTNIEGRQASRCPMMAAFHGRRKSNSVDQDRRTNDLLTAAKLLLNEGFSHEDLQREEVLAEFSRQVDEICSLPETTACSNTETYRRADGSCNNLENALWGMAGTPQRRSIQPAYADGIGSARSESVLGGSLPNARTISNNVHRSDRGAEIRSRDINLHTFQMGQFVDHDMIATPTQGDVTDCCGAQDDTQNCMNIMIGNRNDPFEPMYSAGYCMEFHRSAPLFCPDDFSNGGNRRQQINEITSYIDASNVYGSSQAEQDNLREAGTGKLRTHDGVRLPDNDDNSGCIANQGEACSLAGDHRVNVVPSLTTYHWGFVLLHNQIADELASSFPDPDTLFQETRKVVIGIMQKFVYDEFLPSFLSPDVIGRYQLSSDATYTYDSSIDATIANSFGIAFRMGHTWIPRDMSLFGRDLRPINRRLDTDETYNSPFLTYNENPEGHEGLAYWLSGQNSPETDRIVEEQARSRLFIDRTNNVAFDLAALNIQRGRDHGLPSYGEFRVKCQLSVLTDDWATLVDHDQDTISRLQRAGYQSPRDIDLFTGGLTETGVPGGTVGPTFECILADQFRRLKFGDRFWYQGNDAGLTAAQQQAIRQYSLARMMCDVFNFDRVNSPNAFKASDPRTRCDNIETLNVNAFRPPTTPEPVTTSATEPPNVRPPPPPPPPGGNRRPRPRTFDDVLEDLLRKLEESEQK